MSDIIRKLMAVSIQNDVFRQTAFPGTNGALMGVFEARHRMDQQLSSMMAFRDLNTGLSKRISKSLGLSLFLDNSIQSGLSGLNPIDKVIPRTIRSQFASFMEWNPVLSEKLLGVASSQFQLSQSLNQLAEKLASPQLAIFNSFDVAINAVARKPIRNIALEGDLEELEAVNDVNGIIVDATEEIRNAVGPITNQQFENFFERTVQGLQKLLDKHLSRQAQKFIIGAMTVIGFLALIYNPFQQPFEKHTKEIIIRSETRVVEREVVGQQSSTAPFSLPKKTVRISTPLKFSSFKNARNLGTVVSGQEMTVLSIEGKYFLVAYKDDVSGKPLSGYILKKHCD